MSYQPGYWQASDGNWYPHQQQPPQIIVQQKKGNGCLIATIVAAVLVLIVGGCSILIAVTADAPKTEDKLTIGTEMVPATAGQTIKLSDDGTSITVANGIVDPSPASPIPAGTKCVTIKAKIVNGSKSVLTFLITGRGGAITKLGACTNTDAVFHFDADSTYDAHFSVIAPEAATEVEFSTLRETVIQGEHVGPFAYFKIAA